MWEIWPRTVEVINLWNNIIVGSFYNHPSTAVDDLKTNFLNKPLYKEPKKQVYLQLYLETSVLTC